MKITFRELRKKLSDMAKNVPKVATFQDFAKIHWTDSQKIALERDRKQVVMYVGNYPDYWVPLEFRVGSLWIPSQKVGSLY